MLHGVARSDSANGREETDGGGLGGLDQPTGGHVIDNNGKANARMSASFNSGHTRPKEHRLRGEAR